MQVNKENSRNSAMPIGLTDSSRVSNNSSKVHLDVRVQTYLPTTWMVAYFALLVGLFALALFWMERLFHGSIPPNTWWYYDIPWIALTVASWFPTF
ncbi:hypothetical protein [Alicyclobacillus sp. SO9]|uniref:hypothetical protein n=1 Tax=Alicyclobacillus sp. SO9 TaxID=2665646 RepID=UPI0018E77814|nr:hypothetical protein [Alicyclobacillus sp. SO9]QQE78674.1 hypothetical protein GI364_22935 [Alicyclobacillus sp. SO9]